jgi:hypothetical protein
MTSLLTSISGQFGKAILLGTLFPVLIVSILNELIVAPMLSFGPALQEQLRKIATGEDKWAAVSLLFVVVVITGMLYNLNIPIIRLYEGYPWSNSIIGRLFAWRKKARFREVIPLRGALRSLRRGLRTSTSLPDELQQEQNALALFINSELPDREGLILPTRLGNVIRCFERYSSVAYGMDAIVLWPRLVAKIDSGFAATIDEAKTSLDFMINSSFLCAISALLALTLGILGPAPFSDGFMWRWGWRVVLFLVLAIFSYVFAIGRAKAWGEQVKSAFDLYRFDLLKALGYQQLQPVTFFEEKALWQKISMQLLYADSRENPLPYRSTTHVSVSPVGVQLEVTRVLRASAVYGNLDVELTLQNKSARDARFVMVYDTLPDGFKVLLGSPQSTGTTLQVSSISPPEMKTGIITSGKSAVITYTLKPASS